MDEKQFQDLVAKVGKEAADHIKKEMEAYETKMKGIMEGRVSDDDFKKYQEEIKLSVSTLKEIAEKQGTTLNAINEMLAGGVNTPKKSILEKLEADKDALGKIQAEGHGRKQYMVGVDAKGNWFMEDYNPITKAAGPHATIGDVGTVGNVASVINNTDAAAVLRMGSNAAIVSQFRNMPFLFPLVNLINAGIETSQYHYWDEGAGQGAAALVTEGATKPLRQASYTLQSKNYKKAAMLLNFTEEFNMDFRALQSDIINKSQTDLLNVLNSQILANLISAATAYNTAASYGVVTDPNDWDAIAAMAAQVENSTYGLQANAALMSTFKKYRLGTERAITSGTWLNAPEILNNLALVSNPAMAADSIIVGDLRNYNVALRGGIIVKVGYNGTDFAENKFSTVIEQYYFDWISGNRTSAIVKGPTFADVKGAIDGTT